MKKEHLNWKEAYVKSISEKTEEVNEKLSPKEMKKRLAMIKKAVEKINKQNADAAKKDALKMMKASGMFDEDVEIEEAPLVMDDMAILKTFFNEIETRVSKLKRMKQDERLFLFYNNQLVWLDMVLLKKVNLKVDLLDMILKRNNEKL